MNRLSCILLALIGLASCTEYQSDPNTPKPQKLEEADTTWFSNDKDFSVSLWLKTKSASPDTSIILSNADFSYQDAGIYGRRRTNKGITLYSFDGGWGWNIGNDRLHYLYEPLAQDQPLSDGKWHHLAFSYSSELKEARLFYDGINKAVLKIGDLDNSNFMSSLPLALGGNEMTLPNYAAFDGKIKNPEVWDEVILPEQFKAEYSRRYDRPDEPKMESDILTIVNWNIWHGGTHFTKEDGGFDGIHRIGEMLREANADIVLMQETYGAGSRISSDLGFYYYEASSTIGAVWGANLSVMSRYPMETAYMIEERSNYGKNYAFNNGGVKIRLSPEKSIIAFSNWYNGQKPEDLDGALNGLKNLIDNADTTPIVYGGDFNSISHLDDGLGESGHSKLMEQYGFIDSWRTYHPDVEKYPGKTAPRFEDRIDFVYFKGNKLELISVKPIDPSFKGKNSNTPNYPSDHMGIISRFKVK